MFYEPFSSSEARASYFASRSGWLDTMKEIYSGFFKCGKFECSIKERLPDLPLVVLLRLSRIAMRYEQEKS